MAPTPHFVSCVMSTGVLLAAGSEEQKREWLPRDRERRRHPDAGLATSRDARQGEVGVQLEAKARWRRLRV